MSGRPLLILETATRTPLVALARPDGGLLGERRWESRHRHGEQLLERLDELLRAIEVARRDIGGVIVGTGPGSFTGLRIGLATAKVIAYSLDVPLVGISTTRALALAAGRDRDDSFDIAVTLPAGAADRYVHRLRLDGGSVVELEPARLVAGAADIAAALGDAQIVAVDLDADQVGAGALERGQLALAGLALALATLGARELADGRHEDPAQLVPAYVALPRGIARAGAEMTWSPDLR